MLRLGRFLLFTLLICCFSLFLISSDATLVVGWNTIFSVYDGRTVDYRLSQRRDTPGRAESTHLYDAHLYAALGNLSTGECGRFCMKSKTPLGDGFPVGGSFSCAFILFGVPGIVLVSVVYLFLFLILFLFLLPYGSRCLLLSVVLLLYSRSLLIGFVLTLVGSVNAFLDERIGGPTAGAEYMRRKMKRKEQKNSQTITRRHPSIYADR